MCTGTPAPPHPCYYASYAYHSRHNLRLAPSCVVVPLSSRRGERSTLKVEPQAAAALLAELGACKGADARLDALTAEIHAELMASATTDDPGALERRARVLCDKMAIALQAATLVQGSSPEAAAAFSASRLPGGRESTGWNYGATTGDFGGAAVSRVLIDRMTPLTS